MGEEMDVMVSNPGGSNRFFSSPNRPDGLWGSLNGYRVFFGIKRPGRDVEQSFPSSTRDKNGIITYLLSLYTSTALTETTFPLHFNTQVRVDTNLVLDFV